MCSRCSEDVRLTVNKRPVREVIRAVTAPLSVCVQTDGADVAPSVKGGGERRRVERSVTSTVELFKLMKH